MLRGVGRGSQRKAKPVMAAEMWKVMKTTIEIDKEIKTCRIADR